MGSGNRFDNMFGYNFLLEKIVLSLGDHFFGTSFKRSIDIVRDESRLSQSDLEKLSERRLFEILHHATTKCKYYRELNLVKDSNVYSWLKQFPILTKQILNEYSGELISDDFDNKLIKQSSSGSSGVQSTVYWSKYEQDRYRAIQIHWWEWGGYKLGMPMLQTGINPNRSVVKRLKDFFFRTYYIHAFAHSDNDTFRAFDWVKKRKRVFLGGYASSLFVLAKQAQNYPQKLNFVSAVSWGDKLFEHYKREIKDGFGVNVRETYGSAEGLMIAAQKDLPYMYLMTNNVFVEILDDEGNEVPDGELGHVVVTNLHAKAMPLIRYKIGDLAIKLPKKDYPEKRELGFPLLQKVIGRDTDIIKTKSGKYMVVHSFTGIFEYIPEIKQFMVIQRDLEEIEIHYIVGKGFNKDILSNISEQINKYLVGELEIKYLEVDLIPSTASGKPQLIQSFLPKSF
jgi:phenylacetate-CoA ligase